MAIPKQVREAGDESERLAQQLRKDREGTQPEPPAAEKEPEPTPKEEPPAEPKATPVSDNRSPESDPNYWMTRFKGLKRHHDELVPQLRREVSELQAQIQEIKSQPQQPPAPAAAPQRAGTDAILSVLTDEQRESFSPELLEVLETVGKRAADMAYQQAKGHTDGVAGRVERVEQYAQKSQDEHFWEEIESGIPDWRELHEDQAFLDWVHDFDPLFGKSRFDEIQACQAQYDPARIIAIYSMFKDQRGRQGHVKEDPLADRVTPEGGGPGPEGVATPQGRSFTVTEVQNIYKRMALGKITGDEARRLEKEIEAAHQEGRIRQG